MTAGKRINSRAKGARVEREAAKYLCKLGFKAERNGRNGKTADDLRCDDMPGVHIEVKGDESIDLGTKALEDAVRQAADNCDGRQPCVLWKRKNKAWRLSWRMDEHTATICGDAAITEMLQRWRYLTNG